MLESSPRTDDGKTPLTSAGVWTANLRRAIAADRSDAIAVYRDALGQAADQLRRRFERNEPVEALVGGRAQTIDIVIVTAWAHFAAGFDEAVALVAVGGYGRAELHPCSDIDLLILTPGRSSKGWRKPIGDFLAFLWDIGPEVGHSVRSVRDCAEQGRKDLSVATTLMEARLLTGPQPLFETMRAAVSGDRMWPTERFFQAKVDEQIARHHRYDDTAYNLEPNVKGSPGGLRDIQMIGWVAKRHFGAETLDELVEHGFLSPGQLRILKSGQAFLWKVRFGLHLLTGRREDRLLFDYQVKLSRMLGYEDASYTLAVEQLMQRYYRTVMELSRLNEMLLQQFQEAILMDPNAAPDGINERFEIKNGFLQIVEPSVFEREPSALLEIFLLLQQNPEIKGVSSLTIGQLRRSLWLIDEEFRQNPRHHRMFLEIIRAPEGVTHELRRMNLYGVLGLYIPAFGRIVGRMQYDLFHAYTVDEHTLFVVSNLRRFTLERFDHEFPYCSRIMQNLKKPELAYLAALFHDIAKGRGGDHSEVGAVDAEAFCLEQGLGRYDSRVVAWLVRNHLILSVTAQKKDISDPEVINEFSARVGDQLHLDYLYILTVADVRGTNPKLWNSWKASLFREFYERCKGALRRGLEHPIDQDELIAETQAAARQIATRQGMRIDLLNHIWASLTEDYFLRHRPAEIAWHSELLAERDSEHAKPLIALQDLDEAGGTAIALYTPYRRHTFARATAVLDELGLTILDARILPTRDGFSLDTYVVLEQDGSRPVLARRLEAIKGALAHALAEGDGAKLKVTRRAPRQVRMFSTPVEITFNTDSTQSRTILELVAGDHPGLLSEVGKVFRREGIAIHNAKILTVGERAEDVFYITDEQDQPLDEAAQTALSDALGTALQSSE